MEDLKRHIASHLTKDKKQMQIVNMEVKLYVNRQLFEKGIITEYMYQKAIDIIQQGMPKEKPVNQRPMPYIPPENPPLWLIEEHEKPQEVFTFYGMDAHDRDVELQVISDRGIDGAKEQAIKTFKKRCWQLITYTNAKV